MECVDDKGGPGLDDIHIMKEGGVSESTGGPPASDIDGHKVDKKSPENTNTNEKGGHPPPTTSEVVDLSKGMIDPDARRGSEKNVKDVNAVGESGGSGELRHPSVDQGGTNLGDERSESRQSASKTDISQQKEGHVNEILGTDELKSDTTDFFLEEATVEVEENVASLTKVVLSENNKADNTSGENEGNKMELDVNKGDGSGISGKKLQQQSVDQGGTNPSLSATTNNNNILDTDKGKSDATHDFLKRADSVEENGTSLTKGGPSEKTADKAPGENAGKKIEEADSQEMEVKEISTDSTQASEVVTKNSAEAVDASSGPKDGKNATSQETNQNAKQGDTSDDDGFEAFELLGKRKPKKKKKKFELPQSLRISIPSHTPKDPVSKDHVSFVNNSDALADTFFSVNDIEEEEDPLSFYSNTHEGQDPEYVEFHSSRLKNRLEVELARLHKDKQDDMEKIQAYVFAKWEDRNGTLQKQITKVRVDMVAKQTRQRTQLSEKHKRQIEADERKIEEGEKWLIQKQQLELQQRMNLPNNGMIEWNTIAAQLQSRHTYQRQQFEEKKVEMKKRSEQELKAQNQILEAHHKKRQAEAETYIKELADKCHKQQENLKAKLSRLHGERFEKKQKEIQADCTFTLDGDSHPQTLAQGETRSSQMDLAQREQGFENTPELHVSHRAVKGGINEGSISHDAVVRQKRRKSLMNNATIQLAIEIHNEGIIAMTRSNHQEGEKRSSENSTFIPWGSKARSFLYSICCGEIPSGYLFDQIGRAGRGALGGGLIKCMITDTRTSEDTAICERAGTLAQVQVAKSKAHVEEIERQYANSSAVVANLHAECALVMEKEEKIAVAHKDAVLQHERAKQTLDKFKAQAQHFFNQDGTPSPRVNPDSRQKLLTAMHKYKGAYESTKSKEATLRQPLELAKNALVR
mmetsp:Transcript_7558/g.13621  ORF Transcript_7558/g.13621 Transcript_7558/m.13621 type:complete len:923 (+) Transcript_7558:18-2786(+)